MAEGEFFMKRETESASISLDRQVIYSTPSSFVAPWYRVARSTSTGWVDGRPSGIGARGGGGDW